MKKKFLFSIVLFAFITAFLGAQEKGPVAVSPVSEMGIAKVGTVCPTFSWTAVDWAAGYRVEVFPATEGSELDHNKVSAQSYPLLVKEIPGAATSWTPTAEESLNNEGTYVWFVQALDEYGSGAWSQGRMFMIEANTGFAAIEDAVNDTLIEHGIDPTIIADVIGNMNEAAQDSDVPQIAGDIPISVQGYEASNNTWYGVGAGNAITTGTNNAFFGQYSGYLTQTGGYNTFLGPWAGRGTVSGSSNVFVGRSAGYNNTASENTYVGTEAGRLNTSAAYITAMGYRAGYSNTASYNSFFGHYAGYANTSGTRNVFMGYRSGDSNTTASDNAYFGYYSGQAGTTGHSNSMFGSYSGYTNSTGYGNTFMGYRSGYSNTSGYRNTYLGYEAGYTNAAGDYNTLAGYHAGRLSTSNYNTFFGAFTGDANTTGTYNTFVGANAGTDNTTASYNTLIGYLSGANFTAGASNTAVGYRAGYSNSTGNANTFLGYYAGNSNTGSNNVFLGYNAGASETGSNLLYIDNSSTSSPLIWGDFNSNILSFNGTIGVNTKTPGFPMEMKQTGTNASIVVDRTDGATNYINATSTSGNFGTVTPHVLRLVVNSLWRMRLFTDNSVDFRNGASITAGGTYVNASSRELKENIEDLTADEAFGALEDLNPVKYNYKADKDEGMVGFIAEDVPDLVATKNRKGMTSMDVVAVLTKVVQEQQKTIGELKKEIEELKKK